MRKLILPGLVVAAGLAVALFLVFRSNQPEDLPTTSLPPLEKEEAKKSLLAQAQRLVDAGVNKDHKAMVDLMHPALVRELGGRDKAVSSVTGMMDKLSAQGFKLTSAACSDPSEFAEAAGRMYAVVPTPMMMETAKHERFVFMGYHLGVSADGGRTWRFLGCGGDDMPREKIKKFLPDLPDSLVLPKQSAPILIDPGDG